MARKKRKEAKLLGYEILFNRQGQLITERVSVDITKLKQHLTKEDFNLLRSIMRSASKELDKVHDKIEVDLNARKSF
tara:strand:- start:447 stop:677 length:231 start_codon:yes stop_codon:yes gene_type:complete